MTKFSPNDTVEWTRTRNHTQMGSTERIKKVFVSVERRVQMNSREGFRLVFKGVRHYFDALTHRRGKAHLDSAKECFEQLSREKMDTDMVFKITYQLKGTDEMVPEHELDLIRAHRQDGL